MPLLTLVSVLAISGAAQSQSRQQRQSLSADSLDEPTMLYRREGEPYVVISIPFEGKDYCYIGMKDTASETQFMIIMNGSDFITIGLNSQNAALLPTLSTQGNRLPISVAVDGVSQIYTLKSDPAKEGPDSIEGRISRAAQSHLQSALGSRQGFTVTVGKTAPMRFTVPPKAAEAFDRCVRTILRGRLERGIGQYQQLLNDLPRQ